MLEELKATLDLHLQDEKLVIKHLFDLSGLVHESCCKKLLQHELSVDVMHALFDCLEEL